MKSGNRCFRRSCGKAFIWLLLLCSMGFPSAAGAELDSSVNRSPALLDPLIQEALARSPMIISARKHWQALTKVPIQASTLPDPMIGLQ